MDVQLVMVSIGRPDVGRQLVDHLGIASGDTLLYVDPENALYDALDLNRGVGRTFFNPNTPLSFLERFTKVDGTKELIQVLSKWNKGRFVVGVRNCRSEGLSHPSCSLCCPSW
jgi:hypothetical protein